MTRIFLDICSVRLLEYKDIINYTNWYQIVFDKLFSLLNNNSGMSKKSIEITLQSSLLQHFDKNYLTLVSAIETVWKDKTTNLADTIL